MKLKVNNIEIVQESAGTNLIQTLSIGGTGNYPLYADVYTKEYIDKSNYLQVDNAASSGTITLATNTLTNLTTTQNGTTFTLALGTVATGVVNEYVVVLQTGATAPTITFPASIKWIGGAALVVNTNRAYILNFIKISDTLIFASGQEAV